MKQSDLVITHGNTFVISSLNGDIGWESYQGIFSQDTRHLSQAKLFIDELVPDVLTSYEISFNSAAIFLTNVLSDKLARNSLSIIRKRVVEDGVHEDIEITNNTQNPLTFNLSLDFAADFADIFEVKTCDHKKQCKLPHPHAVVTNHNKAKNYLQFSYTRGNFTRKTKMVFGQKANFDGNRVRFSITLRPKDTWRTCIPISFLNGNRKLNAPSSCAKIFYPKRNLASSTSEMGWAIPTLESNWDELGHSYSKSISDLASLHIHSIEASGQKGPLLAAGIPWFVALFGRDSLITSYQTLLLGSKQGVGTLRTLAKYQGKKIDTEKEEEPGKILHEMRFGEVAHFGEWAKFPYYGSVDATPLFLILLSEVYRWSGDEALIKQMKNSALLALEWIDNYADMDNDGFVEYKRKSSKGLKNQNWRDSDDSMFFSNGKIAQAPIASADVQGYVYDAKLRIAEIAEKVWGDMALANKLKLEAKRLKEKFNRDFWIKEKGYFAIGLDKEKRPIDTLSSSIGHLLWSGIVDDNKILKILEHLFSEDLYSGWGIRTVSKKSIGYNPLGYHTGTVWPHDNSIIAAGLRLVGYKNKSLKIIKDILDASSFFSYRLPEVFAGFAREVAPFPVEYPTASSPQAWASAAPILFLKTLLGIEPDTEQKTLRIDPILPPQISYIKLNGISAFGKYFLIEVTRDKSSIKEINHKPNPQVST